MGAGYGSQFSRTSVKVGELSVQYLKGGRGRPLLYLHGIGGWGRWETYHLGMGVTNEVYAPQLPGWQTGKIPPSIGSVQDYARTMLGFLDALELDSVDLVGHSIGGWIALRLACEQPDRVSRLVLVDPLGLDCPAHPGADLARIDEDAFLAAAFAKTGTVLIAADFGGHLEDVRSGPEFKRQWKGRRLVAELTKGRGVDADLSHSLQSIRVPTLIVWGQKDGLVPWQQGEMLAAAIPGARLACIAEASHSPMRDKRETFQQLVHEFLVGQAEAEQVGSPLS
jgi:pimeloyl-ACP methyl ester carboxylesterase